MSNRRLSDPAWNDRHNDRERKRLEAEGVPFERSPDGPTNAGAYDEERAEWKKLAKERPDMALNDRIRESYERVAARHAARGGVDRMDADEVTPEPDSIRETFGPPDSMRPEHRSKGGGGSSSSSRKRQKPPKKLGLTCHECGHRQTADVVVCQNCGVELGDGSGNSRKGPTRTAGMHPAFYAFMRASNLHPSDMIQFAMHTPFFDDYHLAHWIEDSEDVKVSKCPDCSGTSDESEKPCERCKGEGVLEKYERKTEQVEFKGEKIQVQYLIDRQSTGSEGRPRAFRGHEGVNLSERLPRDLEDKLTSRFEIVFDDDEKRVTSEALRFSKGARINFNHVANLACAIYLNYLTTVLHPDQDHRDCAALVSSPTELRTLRELVIEDDHEVVKVMKIIARGGRVGSDAPPDDGGSGTPLSRVGAAWTMIAEHKRKGSRQKQQDT